VFAEVAVTAVFALALICCLVLDISTIFAPAPLPLVFAEVAATAVFALALRLPLEKKLNKKGKKG